MRLAVVGSPRVGDDAHVSAVVRRPYRVRSAAARQPAIFASTARGEVQASTHAPVDADPCLQEAQELEDALESTARIRSQASPFPSGASSLRCFS